MDICGESEGLDEIATLGGELHWLIAPFDPGCSLSFGPSSALLHFVPAPKHERFEVEVSDVEAAGLPGMVSATVRATQGGRPLQQARVSFAGAEARTGKDGRTTVEVSLELPGRFKAVARRGQNYGLSDLVPVGLASAKRGAPLPGTGAG